MANQRESKGEGKCRGSYDVGSHPSQKDAMDGAPSLFRAGMNNKQSNSQTSADPLRG